MSNQKKYFPKELSWLSFNERVLQEAADAEVPIIERVRFLGIYSNNMDEFFRVRVADVHRQIDFLVLIVATNKNNWLQSLFFTVLTRKLVS